MKKILIATVLAALGSSSALAADMPARGMYTKAPVADPAVNWSGFYAGVNIGYGWENGGTDFAFTLPNTSANTTLGAKSHDVIGGAQIGYNWQMGHFVTGLEADIQGSGTQGSATKPVFRNDGTEAHGDFLSTEHGLSWFGTVRGRLGTTITPNVLIYATGGLAYGEVRDTANATYIRFSDGSFSDTPSSVSKLKAGWTIGAGGEWMFARGWSAKMEYLHVDLGNVSAVGSEVDHFPTASPPPDRVGYTWHNQEDIVRVGVNYHFN
jgi:outer membrane immunogenic protein